MVILVSAILVASTIFLHPRTLTKISFTTYYDMQVTINVDMTVVQLCERAVGRQASITLLHVEDAGKFLAG
jgi:hypothetical protein